MLKKEYLKGVLTVVWQPDLCIHSGVCFRQLPAVFKPRERPWVQLDGADEEAIRKTVLACPSGALSLKEPVTDTILSNIALGEPTQVLVQANGPLKIIGPCKVTMPDGSVVEKPNGASFCRCGASSRKPFCDSTHKTIGFIG